MERHITVTGTGMVSADPDRCRIDLRVSASSPSVEEATRTMSIAARAVLDALRDAGAERVSTGRFSIRPDHDKEGQPVGFRSETAVGAEVAVSEGSASAVSSLLQAAVSAGGDRLSIDGVTFEHSDPAAQEQAALRAAVTDARSRAEVIADSAGASVGEVVAIEEEVRAAPGPVRLRAVGAETAAIPVEPGAHTTTVQVKASFEIA